MNISQQMEIITIEIEMTQTMPAAHGLGFCGKEFNEWTSKTWNNGDNHSMLLYQHGYGVTSAEFSSNDISSSEQYTNYDWRQWYKYQEMWNDGDTVFVEMDMNELKGKIWNKDKSDIVCVVGLPSECTFLLMMGYQTQIITINNIHIDRSHT